MMCIDAKRKSDSLCFTITQTTWSELSYIWFRISCSSVLY